MKDAKELFDKTFVRWVTATALISNFRSTFTAVASSASEHLQVSVTETFRRLHEDPDFEGILLDIRTGEPATAETAVDYQKLGKIGAEVIYGSSYASLDAAALVFYHSLLDGTVFDCCRVTALLAPQDWEQDLKNTQVPLLEIHNKSYDQLLRDKLSERLEKLEKESLLTKVDRLFSRCQPPPRWSPMRGYFFHRGRIGRFDAQRHEIVHGEALGNPFSFFSSPKRISSTCSKLGCISWLWSVTNMACDSSTRPPRSTRNPARSRIRLPSSTAFQS